MSYLSTILADTPVHYWRCADGGGQIAHDIGSVPVHLVVTGSPLLGYSGPSSNGGAFFTPTGNSLSSATKLVAVNSPYSVECWVWTVATITPNRYLLAWDAAAGAHVLLVLLNTGAVQFSVSGGAGALSPGTISDQHWHHIVGTYDNANQRLYVDGALVATVANVGPQNINRQIGWGADPNGNITGMEGFISEAAIYSYVLTGAQISAHFAAAEQPTQSPVYIAVAGAAATSGVNSGTNPAGIQDVLSSVRKTY